MAETRRAADVSRALLIEAAAQIIDEEGYAALSARALAEKVGLKRQIVHYYFRTMDELLLAVVRHYGDESVQRLSRAMTSGNPLRAIWQEEPDASATTYAFMAMAKHQPAIRLEVEKYFHVLRDLKIAAVDRFLADSGVTELSAATAVTIIQSIAQGLKAEEALGAISGHVDTRAIIEQWLNDPVKISECMRL